MLIRTFAVVVALVLACPFDNTPAYAAAGASKKSCLDICRDKSGRGKDNCMRKCEERKG